MADASTQPTVRILSPTDFPDQSAEELLAEILETDRQIRNALVILLNLVAAQGHGYSVDDLGGY